MLISQYTDYLKMSGVLIKGMYRHTKTGNLYKVVGLGRSVENPNKQVVIYEQQYESRLRDTDTRLPYGSVWTRSLEDFNSYEGGIKKFVKI